MMSESDRNQAASATTLGFPKRVVILGSDVCAWMSATLLFRFFGRLGIHVTVCSDGRNPNGTDSNAAGFQAFSTTSALTGLLKNIGIDEHDMLRACHGTYKLATQYSDWATEGRDFWQPLGMNSQRVEGFPLFDTWLSERKAGRLLRPLHSYSAHWTASLAGKSPHSFSATSDFAASGDYGFHVDAKELASWFRGVALASGVEEASAAIQNVAQNDRGGIAQIVCDDGKEIAGDLFLDCRVVSESRLSDRHWISWNEQFQCDRVASIRTPAFRQVPVFTRTCGHTNGWSSTIPLTTDVETRFAFCSQSETDQEATKRLKTLNSFQDSNVLKDTNGESADTAIQFQSINYGRRTSFWKDNVVSLGNAACLLDSVAGTDLHLQQAGIELLMELFPDRNIGKATRTEYNSRMSSITDEFRDVVQLHHASRRPPTASSTQKSGENLAATEQTSPYLSEELRQQLSVYDLCGAVQVRNSESMTAEDLRCFLAGCGRLPNRPSLSVRSVDPNHIQNVLRETVKRNEAVVKDLPLHEELLDWIHSGPFQQSVG